MSEHVGSNGGEPARGSGVPVRDACFCVALFFALVLCFNGDAMVQSARLLEYGRVRDFWVAVLRPVGAISRGTRLSCVRQTLQDKAGRRLNQASKTR
jgi:hypothetical protein